MRMERIKIMTKKFFAVFAVLLVAGVCVWNWQKGDETLKQVQGDNRLLESKGTVADKPVVKIGVITSLTGKFAENGNNAKTALQLAKEDLGNSPIDFKLVFEDYGYEPAKAAVAANKLINLDKANALISWSSMAGNVVAPIAQSNKIVNFAISNDRAISGVGKYNFIHWTPSEKLTDKFIETLHGKNYKRIVMFVVYQASLQKDADILQQKMSDLGIEVERVNFAIDNKDFNLSIEEMKRKDFDAWYVAALPPSLDIFLNSFFQKKVNKPLLAIDSFTFAKEKGMLEGFEYVTVPEGNLQLLQKITEKNGSENYFSVGYVYDAGKMLMETYNQLYMQLGKIPNSDEVSEALMKVKNYQGAVGLLNVDENRIVQSEAVIKKVHNGKTIEIEEQQGKKKNERIN